MCKNPLTLNFEVMISQKVMRNCERINETGNHLYHHYRTVRVITFNYVSS